MNQDLMKKKHGFPVQLSSVFFGSQKAALISTFFGLAVAALLYIAYLQVREAAHIDLPTGQSEEKISRVPTALRGCCVCEVQ